MDLSDTQWREFVIGEVFDVINSKAYHKNDLFVASDKEIPYVARSKFNNGLDSFVEEELDFVKNPKNSIVFGAESAMFFYEPFEYITGNKMYYIYHEKFNKYICLFLVAILNNAIANSTYGFGYGLTGSRLKNVRILLPIDDEGQPNYLFMIDYMKELEQNQIKKYKDYLDMLKISNYKELDNFESIKWNEFVIGDLFTISSGKRLTKANMEEGNIPFIGATSLNNGITNFVSNINESLDANVLGVNYNGSVVESFYHQYKCIFSDDVKRFHLKDYSDNKYVLLFFKTILLKQKEKYMYGYKFNADRMKRQSILVPINSEGKPNYKFMEQYMINLEISLLEKYLDYLKSD